MRHLIPALLLGSLALAEDALPLTLDPGMYADALREVQQGKAAEGQPRPAQQPAGPSAPGDAAEWCLAMQEAGSPQAEVRLILLLRRLNPDAGVEPLAEAVDLHRLMLAGNARACAGLAQAFRSGVLPNGLLFICHAGLAEAVQARAVPFQFAPGALPTGQPPHWELQPSSEAKGDGASG